MSTYFEQAHVLGLDFALDLSADLHPDECQVVCDMMKRKDCKLVRLNFSYEPNRIFANVEHIRTALEECESLKQFSSDLTSAFLLPFSTKDVQRLGSRCRLISRGDTMDGEEFTTMMHKAKIKVTISKDRVETVI